MHELRTERLSLSPIAIEDDAFVLELLNDPGWVANIGDRGVRTLAEARSYIRDRFLVATWFVARDASGTAVGICGLVDRPGLEHLDIGYAFLERHATRGYATEAAQAVLQHARAALGHAVILAVTKPDNRPSQRVLEKIGLAYVGLVDLPGYPDSSALYSTQGPPQAVS